MSEPMECARCGWPVTRWTHGWKHVANRRLGPTPCRRPPAEDQVLPRGSTWEAVQKAIHRPRQVFDPGDD